jgi:hypothetical protein
LPVSWLESQKPETSQTYWMTHTARPIPSHCPVDLGSEESFISVSEVAGVSRQTSTSLP